VIHQDLTFSWRWDNLESVVEYLEARPDRGTALITKTTDDLKEGAINAFADLFAGVPLTRPVLEYAAPALGDPVALVGGLLAVFGTLHEAAPDPLHPPITRTICFHQDSDRSIEHISVCVAVALRLRFNGDLSRFCLSAVKSKYQA
jgi:hypothetical protein